MNSRFNLSDWALEHRSLVWYFMIVFGIAGIFAYTNLGREEDPSFTIKTMVIAAQWPGATVEETSLQVTDRIEKKLEELDSLDYTRSQTTPGQTVIYVNLKDTIKSRDVPGVWVKVRNMVNDVKRELPQGVVGPVFNDDFGDVYGNVYAFTADGLTQRQLRDYVEDVRAKVLTVPNVGKVNLIGAQDEVIFLEFSTREMAALGISQQDVIQTLQAQNAITPSGVIQAGPERISVRVTGQFTSEESLRDLNLRINDRFFRLSDVATISRGYVDPPQALFRFKGQPAIGLAIGMKTGANLLAVRRGAARADGQDHRRIAHRRRRASRGRSAHRGRGGGRRLHQGPVRGRRDRAGGQLPEPGHAGRVRGRAVDPARAGHDLRGHAVYRHLACSAFRLALSSSRSVFWSTMR